MDDKTPISAYIASSCLSPPRGTNILHHSCCSPLRDYPTIPSPTTSTGPAHHLLRLCTRPPSSPRRVSRTFINHQAHASTLTSSQHLPISYAHRPNHRHHIPTIAPHGNGRETRVLRSRAAHRPQHAAGPHSSHAAAAATDAYASKYNAHAATHAAAIHIPDRCSSWESPGSCCARRLPRLSPESSYED